MENLFLLLATSFALKLPTARKLKNRRIGNTGCAALMFNKNFRKNITPSGDCFYFNESSEKDVTYGLICVEMNEQYELEEATEMLSRYINKLKAPFFILHNTGLANDADWNHVSSAALVDYWQDGGQQDWKIKGYTNGRTMAVLYVKNIARVEVKKQDLFLDSFHFRAA